MRVVDTIKLAILNIKSNLKMVFSIIIGTVIILQIIMNMFAYGLSLNKYIKNTINKRTSLRYATLLSDDISIEFIEENRNEIEGIQSICKYNIYNLCEDNNYKIQTIPLENKGISFDAAIMELNNQTYKGKNDYSYDFGVPNSVVTTSKEKSVRYEIGVMDYNGNLQIAENEIDEYKNKFGKKEIFIHGGVLTGENQIIITDYILKCFGYEGSLSDCIGKKISLYISTDNGDICLVNNYTIQGIMDSDLYRVESRKDMPQIIISNADKKYCDNYKRKVFTNSFNGVVNISNNNENVFLIPTSESFGYSEIETLYIFFYKIIVGIGIVVAISLFVFVYVVIYFYFKKRNRYICIQRAMGIQNQEIYRMIFFELLLLDVVSIIIALPIFYKIMIYTNKMVEKMISSGYIITKMDMGISVAAGLMILFVLTFAVSCLEGCKTIGYSVIKRRE